MSLKNQKKWNLFISTKLSNENIIHLISCRSRKGFEEEKDTVRFRLEEGGIAIERIWGSDGVTRISKQSHFRKRKSKLRIFEIKFMKSVMILNLKTTKGTFLNFVNISGRKSMSFKKKGWETGNVFSADILVFFRKVQEYRSTSNKQFILQDQNSTNRIDWSERRISQMSISDNVTLGI